MKISGSGTPLPPEGAPAPGVDEARGPGGKFAEAVDRPAGGAQSPDAARASQASGKAGPVGPVGDLVADLRAGKVSAQAALEKVIDRVLAQQVGRDAPAAVRERVETALRQALEDDPLLADRLRKLGA
jgi:hypothetical protein